MAHTFHILVIDDDPDLLSILKFTADKVFQEAYFTQVYSIEESEVYFSELNGYGPNLILLDLDFGGSLEGIELLKPLLEDHQTKLIPKVILTGIDVGAEIGTTYELGASSFTQKPTGIVEWENYFHTLRKYWFLTTTTPKVLFNGQARNWNKKLG